MHKEYILLNGFRKAKNGFIAGFRVPLIARAILTRDFPSVSPTLWPLNYRVPQVTFQKEHIYFISFVWSFRASSEHLRSLWNKPTIN